VDVLDQVEVRVVGSLIEKQITTPEYYPLTLNALIHACNQTSNRHPVVAFDEKIVARALESLRDKRLIHVVIGSDARVPKYKEMLTQELSIPPAAVATLCVLMLRGPQTIGEIRGRTGRLYDFAELSDVEETLGVLIDRSPPLVALLPRQAGQKDSRYAHLLAGDVQVEQTIIEPRPEPVMLKVRAENEKIVRLEEEVASLRQQLAELQQEFRDFKDQFS